MTNETLLKERATLRDTLNIYEQLEAAGLIPYIIFVSHKTVFMEDDVDAVEIRRKFREFFGNNEHLQSYFISSGRLAVKYTYGSWGVVFFFSDVETVLEKISGGACHIEKREELRTEKMVICGLLGDQE